ncbi:hypothetical protein OC834_006043 [Tilletia horrida]|nr:hypothetical protein OC834_006043 [Tilletia horrida]
MASETNATQLREGRSLHASQEGSAPERVRLEGERRGAAAARPGWRLPPVPGIPDQVQAHAEALRGAYLNAGRLNGGLARLNAASLIFAHATERRDKAAQQTARTIASMLSNLEQDIARRLRQSQNRFDDEVGALKARMQDEVQVANSAVFQQLREVATNIGAALEAGEGNAQGEVKEAWQHLCTTRSELEEDINWTEETYMGTLSQLVMFNSWTAAWYVEWTVRHNFV